MRVEFEGERLVLPVPSLKLFVEHGRLKTIVSESNLMWNC